MTVSVLNRTFRGLAELKLKRLSDGAILHLPTPSTFVVENNVEEKIQYTRTATGERSRAGSYVTGREPLMRIVYSHMQPETVQFKIGNSFETKTSSLQVAKSFSVTKNDYPAVTSGVLGYNVADDAVTQASVTRNNISFQLTQTPFASFNATTNDTFSIGEGLNVKFSNNLVTANETVSMLFTETFTGLGISDNVVGAFAVVANLITTQNKLVIFKADYINPSFAGSGIDPAAEQVELPFFVNTPSGYCFPYEMFWTNVSVGC